MGGGLHNHLEMNKRVVAKGVAGLQIIGLGTAHLLVPLDQEAGAVTLQVGRHRASSSRCSSQTERDGFTR